MNTKIPPFLLSLSAMLAALAPLPAQRYGGTWDIRWQIDGGEPGMENGHAVIGVPDLNTDGVPDVVVGAPFADFSSFVDNGIVRAYSGATGALLWTHFGRQDYEGRGWSLAPAGDWNFDGVGDIATGSPFYDLAAVADAGLVKILDGVTGVDIFTFPGVNAGDLFGYAVAGATDFDNDGFDDLLVGAPFADYGGLDSGRTYVYSGALGALVHTVDGMAAGAFAGFSVSWAGDVDADLWADFLVGAPDASPGGVFEAGQVMLVSGLTATLHRVFPGPSASAHLGHAVAGGSDLSSDGVPDLVLAAPGASPGGTTAAGMVFVRSGSTGMLLYAKEGAAVDDRLGTSVALTEDLNKDGWPDLALGGRGAGTEGFLQLHDGPSGLRLGRLDGANPGDDYGCAAASVGDQDGDGEPELAVGVCHADPPGFLDAGQVHILGFEPCLTATSDRVSAVAGGVIDFLLDFPPTEAGQSYALLGSASGTGPSVRGGVAIPLTEDALFLDFASGSPPAGMSGVYGTLDPAGDGMARATVAPGALSGLIGRTFWFAGVSYAPPRAPRVSSVAVSLTIDP